MKTTAPIFSLICYAIILTQGLYAAEPVYKYKHKISTLFVKGSSTPSDSSGSTPNPKIVFSSTGPLIFDNTDVGQTSPSKSIIVLNEGDANYLFGSNLLVNGTNPNDFSVSSNCLNVTLAPAASCAISFEFKPASAGLKSANLDLSSVVPGTNVQLSGEGFKYDVSLSVTSITGLASVVGEVSPPSSTVLLFDQGNKPSYLSSLSFSGPFILGTASSGCAPADLAVSPKNLSNSSCSFTFKFAPQAAGQNQAGSVSFQTSAGVKTLNLSGSTTTREATLSTTSLAYVGTAVGASGDKAVTISNNSQETLTLNPQVTTGATDYSIVAAGQYPNMCSASLAPGQTCSLYVKFAPTASGNRIGSLSLGSNGTNEPLSISLSGTGLVYTSTLTPATDSDFGVVNVGQSVSKSFTFTNTGNTVLSGIYAELINGVGLTLTSNTCGTQASPVSFGPGNTCTIQVQFAPQSAYTLSGAKINVNSNATASPNSVSFTGSAINSDPNYANVVLFMNMNGSVGATIAANADATGKTVTATGSTATYSNTAVFGQSANFTTQSVGGGGGCNPAPTTSLEVARNANFEMNTTDYTLELRVRPTTLSGYQGLVSNYESCAGTIRGWVLYFQGTKLLLNHSNAGADKTTTFATTFANSNWYHLALVKTGSTISLYVNGVKDSVVVAAGNPLSTSAVNLRIGSIHTIAASGFIGQMDELRMTRNVARYTANFTPNSTALTYP